MKKLLATILCVCSCAFFAIAQVEEVKSFKNTNEFTGARLLNNGKILFSAQDDNGNRQLWVTDGTAAGTVQLTNPCPSSTYSTFYDPFSSNYGLFSDGNYYYSVTNTNCSGQTLKIFKTDGNTVTYSNQSNKDFGSSTGNDWSKIYDSASVGDKIYFFALAKTIYSYDKNTGNVALVYNNKDKYPVANNDIHYLGKDGNDLILYLYNPHILVRFNTTTNTVSQFYDIKQYYQNAVGYDVKPGNFFINSTYTKQVPNVYSWNGSNYFWISYQEKDFVTSYALWKTDGTAAGTEELHRFTRSKAYLDRTVAFTPFNGKLYFRFSDKTNSGLWMTDGTAQGTSLVKALNKDTNYHSADGVISTMEVMNNKLYFMGSDKGGGSDFELWESDGTTAGTKQSFEFQPGSFGIMTSNNTVPFLYKYQNRLYWMSSFFTAGDQLITTDGTINGTYSLGGGFSRTISPVVFSNGYAYFSSRKSGGGYALNRVAINNQKPLLLSSVTGNIEKGGKVTVTGFDLRGTHRVDLFLPDAPSGSGGLGQSVQQINDTAISFTLPTFMNSSSFRIAVNTPQGTFLSRQAYSLGTSINEKGKATSPFSLSQSGEYVTIDFLENGRNYELKMIDIAGKVIESRSVQNSRQLIINKRDYKPGIYILQINNAFAEKIIVW